MIDAASITAMVETYRKHGWDLRRVLLSGPARRNLANVSECFPGVPVFDSDIDAAWFSRPPTTCGVAWELRYLGDTPFALVEKLDEESAEFESELSVVESRLKDAIAKKQTA